MPAYRRVPAHTVADLRQAPGNGEPSTPATDLDPTPPAPEGAKDEGVSYRDLQAQAKELGVPANQSREDLEAAIAEAER